MSHKVFFIVSSAKNVNWLVILITDKYTIHALKSLLAARGRKKSFPDSLYVPLSNNFIHEIFKNHILIFDKNL